MSTTAKPGKSYRWSLSMVECMLNLPETGFERQSAQVIHVKAVL